MTRYYLGSNSPELLGSQFYGHRQQSNVERFIRIIIYVYFMHIMYTTTLYTHRIQYIRKKIQKSADWLSIRTSNSFLLRARQSRDQCTHKNGGPAAPSYHETDAIK